MRLVWTQTAWTTKATPRLYAQEKRAWLSEEMKMLERVHMVYFDQQGTFAIVATALQRGIHAPIGCGLPGGERSSRKRSVAANALGRGARFLLWDDLLDDD